MCDVIGNSVQLVGVMVECLTCEVGVKVDC